MRSLTMLLHTVLVLVLLFVFAAPTVSAAKGGGYQTGLQVWETNGFGGFALDGVAISNGQLVLDPALTSSVDPYPEGGYYGGNYYNGGSFFVGEATSPVVPVNFAFTEAIASWNASTPAGSWVEVQLRASLAGRWSKWYSMGVWASTSDTVQRHSVKLQGDADGYVAVDTLVLTAKKVKADALQLKVRLFSTDGVATPTVSLLSVAYSTQAPRRAIVSAGNPANWGTLLDVPECSQMVYPDGGNVWCSPTSTSMVLGYYGYMTGPCEPRVRDAVVGVYDWIYDGHGNWVFNTAYAAAAAGKRAYVARFTSFTEAEGWVKDGVPVVFSFAWGKGDLTGAAIPSSSGHLAVIVGFDANGNVIVNDPAAASNDDVQRTYLRSELEPLWLQNSGGTVYLIY